MSKDLSIFSTHNLDTSSIENLAIDLTNTFDVNIVYGFVDELSFWKYDPSKYRYGFNILGENNVNKSEVTVSLSIDNYLPKKIYEEIGDKIYDDAELYFGLREGYFETDIERKRIINDLLQDIDRPFEFNYFDESEDFNFTQIKFKNNNLPIAQIQKDYLKLKLEFFSSWNGITSMVNEEFEDSREFLNEYRKIHREFAQLFGEVKNCLYTSLGGSILEFAYYKNLVDNLLVIENAPIYSFSELFTNERSFSEFQEYRNSQKVPDIYIDDFRDLIS